MGRVDSAYDENHLLTVAEVAELMGLTPGAVHYIQSIGVLCSEKKVGRMHLFRLAAVEKAVRLRAIPKKGVGRPCKQIEEIKSKKTKKATQR